MKKGYVFIISIMLVLSIVIVFVMNNEDGEKEEATLNRSKEYLEDPEGYMKDLNDQYKQEDHVHSHDKHEDEQESPEEIAAFYEKQKAKWMKEDELIFTDENYVILMNLIDQYPDEFSGKKVELTGYVYREAEFTENQFVIGRRADPCCTESPEAIYGVLSTIEQANAFQDEQWVKVTGKLTKTTFIMSEVPYLVIETIEAIKAPEEPFVEE